VFVDVAAIEFGTEPSAFEYGDEEVARGDRPVVEAFSDHEHVLGHDAPRVRAEYAGGPGIAGPGGLGGRDVPAAPGAQGRDHAGLRVENAKEEVGGLDTGIIDVARVLDSGVDGGAGLGGEAFEDGRDWPWARCRAAAAGELGGAALDDRVINRRPGDWIGGIDERLGASDPEFAQDPGCEVLFAERD